MVKRKNNSMDHETPQKNLKPVHSKPKNLQNISYGGKVSEQCIF